MILRSHLRLPVTFLTIPAFTDKWDLAEMVYYLACDNAMSGIRKLEHLDYCVNSIYSWIDALIDYDDIHLTDLLAEKVYYALENLYKNYDFMMAINSPYELTECSARVNRGDKYVTFYFEYEDNDALRRSA